MRYIPFLGVAVITRSEMDDVSESMERAVEALDNSAALNVALGALIGSAARKIRMMAELIATQSENGQKLMQLNLLLANSLGRIRSGEDIDEVIGDLESQMAEYEASTEAETDE